MIIVRLFGGLGNQLFQYAAARSLALHHNTIVKIDPGSLKDLAGRELELQYFNIPLQIASPEEIRHYTSLSFFSKYFEKLIPTYKRSIYKEPHFHFDPHFFEAGADIYLKGYWQSEKYFKNIEPVIRRELVIRDEFIQHLKEKAALLQAENSVLIHIRRGDYLKKEILEYHGIMDEAYYNRAIDYVSSKTGPVKVYFFSDDIDWVKQHIRIDYPYEFVTQQITRSAIEDFYLMTRCRHSIIANSSFSWWAAWLNNHSSKVVVAPKQWLKISGLNTKDVIPDTWYTM